MKATVLVSPNVHPEIEGRNKGILTMGKPGPAPPPPPELLTVVWLEALPPVVASIFADCVLEATELVIEAEPWGAAHLCVGLWKARVRGEQIRKTSQRKVAPLEEDTGFIFHNYRGFSHVILNFNVQGIGRAGEGRSI